MLNFQITIMLVLSGFILVLMTTKPVFLMSQGFDRDPGIFLGNIFAVFPPFLILIIGVFTTYQVVVNTVRALSDKPIRYPLSISFVR